MSDTKTAEQKPYSITLTNVRLSYPNLFKPRLSQDGKGEAKYSASFLLDKTEHKKQIEKLRMLMDLIHKEKNEGKKLPPDRIALRDGSMKPDVDGYHEDMVYVTASNTRKPRAVGRNPKIDLAESDDLLYPGCVVNCNINFWFQNNTNGKRINGSLNVVQYVGPGEPLGGAGPVDASAVMPTLDDTPSDDDLMG